MNVVGSGWLALQLGAGILYILFTVRCFVAKQENALPGRGMQGLSIAALASPGIAFFQPHFWSFVGYEALLWWAFLFYEGFLLDAVRPEQKNGVFLLVPVMCWVYGFGAGVLVYVPFAVLRGILESV